MSYLSFDARPFAEHVPDSGPDAAHRNPSSVEPGAGMIELGFYIGDHRVVLQSLKAGAYTDLFENGDPTTGRPAQSASSSASSSGTSGTSSEPDATDPSRASSSSGQQQPSSGEQQPQNG